MGLDASISRVHPGDHGNAGCHFAIPNRISAASNYYRDRYLRDVERNRPDFVLDAVGPQAFAYHDVGTEGIAGFPELAAFVASDYRLAYRTDSIRLYRRK